MIMAEMAMLIHMLPYLLFKCCFEGYDYDIMLRMIIISHFPQHRSIKSRICIMHFNLYCLRFRGEWVDTTLTR